jgi:hypothetical protein
MRFSSRVHAAVRFIPVVFVTTMLKRTLSIESNLKSLSAQNVELAKRCKQTVKTATFALASTHV